METLIIKKTLSGEIFLSDSKNNLIGFFPSIEDAAQWAKENGYRSREQI